MMTPYSVYIDYLALKRHFTVDNYDYFKYNGKVKANFSSYDKRKDKYFFEKLSNKKHCHDLMLCCISEDPDMWIGDIVNSDDLYKRWKSRILKISYIFSEDIKKIKDNFTQIFEVIDGQHPILLKLLLSKEISKETFIILNKLIKFVPVWNRKIDDDIIWPKINLNMKKYSSFIDIDEYKYKDLLKKVLKDT